MWCCAVSDHRDFSDAYDEVIDEPHRTKDAEEGVSIIPDSDDRGADSAINWVDMSNWDNEPSRNGSGLFATAYHSIKPDCSPVKVARASRSLN